MVIADTTIWVDHFRGFTNPHTVWLQQQIDQQPIGLIDLILCEILQGIRTGESVKDVRARLGSFELFETGGEDLAVEISL